MIILSLIVVSAITVAFVSRPNPPSFVVATGDAYDYITAQKNLMAESVTKQDSIGIFNNLADAINDFNATWDIDEEMERGPIFPYAYACNYQCVLNYLNQPYVPLVKSEFLICHNVIL